MKKTEENCYFPFLFFCITGSKNDETCLKNEKMIKIKKWKKRGKLQFSICWQIIAPLEAKMMKNEKKQW